MPIDNQLNPLFDELQISQHCRSLYFLLLKNGPCSAKQLALQLGIPRPSVYTHLNSLINYGLITELVGDSRKLFQIENPKKIDLLIQEKFDRLEKAQATYKTLLPSLIETVSVDEPRIKFYSGVEGLKQALNQILLHRNKETISMWPIDDIVTVLGDDYFLSLDRKRVKQNLHIRGIWPSKSKMNTKGNPYLGAGPEMLREVRQAPDKMNWHMGYWIVDNVAVFISSQNEITAFVIQSRDFTDLLRSQFEFIWLQSKTIAK